MKTQITILALGILMIAGAMAATYAGETESYKHDMDISSLVYYVVNNSSSMENLFINVSSEEINITFPQDMQPGSFSIIFFDNQTREVEKIVYRGGGGSRTKYVDRDVTVYVPEYITTVLGPEESTKEKEITKIIYDDNAFELWHVLLGMAVGLLFGSWVVSSLKKD